MKLVLELDRDESSWWVAECRSIPGCISQGVARHEALANLNEAIAACLEVRYEKGMPLTVPVKVVM